MDMIEASQHLKYGTIIYSKDSANTEVQHILKNTKYENIYAVTDIKEIYDSYKEDGFDIKYISPDEQNLDISYKLTDSLREAYRHSLYLKSGGTIVVDETEAMTVIDVNTSKAVSGKDAQKNFLKINKEAASVIADLIRLRNISGIIMVDFINLKGKDAEKE